jgi:hypothetical protein
MRFSSSWILSRINSPVSDGPPVKPRSRLSAEATDLEAVNSLPNLSHKNL